MRAGDLNRLVSVQQRAATQDEFGGQSTTWTEIKKVYAHIEGLYAREMIAAQAVASEVSHRITVRYDAALWADPKAAARYRIVYAGRNFNINGVTNEDERDAVIELLCAESMNDG